MSVYSTAFSSPFLMCCTTPFINGSTIGGILTRTPEWVISRNPKPSVKSTSGESARAQRGLPQAPSPRWCLARDEGQCAPTCLSAAIRDLHESPPSSHPRTGTRPQSRAPYGAGAWISTRRQALRTLVAARGPLPPAGAAPASDYWRPRPPLTMDNSTNPAPPRELGLKHTR